MSASNFIQGDESYIYVPKIFRKKRIDYFMIKDEIDYIRESVLNKIRDFLNKQFSKKRNRLEDYSIEAKKLYSYSYSYDGYSIKLYHFFEDGSYDNSEIFFYYVNGYYDKGNLGYEVSITEYTPKYIERLTEQVCILIEKELKKYCDKYKVLYTASNGETAYQKISKSNKK